MKTACLFQWIFTLEHSKCLNLKKKNRIKQKLYLKNGINLSNLSVALNWAARSDFRFMWSLKKFKMYFLIKCELRCFNPLSRLMSILLLKENLIQNRPNWLIFLINNFFGHWTTKARFGPKNHGPNWSPFISRVKYVTFDVWQTIRSMIFHQY
jgi:hypothetical protein